MEKDYYRFHQEQQASHWWFLARNMVIDAFLKAYVNGGPCRILDIGSGFGSTVSTLKKRGPVEAVEYYVEAFPRLYALGVERIYDVRFPSDYPDKRYDMVTLFDVLEHIENDYEALKVIKERLLSPGGQCVLTVPAYSWLWSRHDEINRHFRRYDERGLKRLLDRAGFRNVRTSHYMTLLFPLAVMERLVSRFLSPGHSHITNPSRPINGILTAIFALESKAIGRMRLPFGLSLIARGEM